MDFLSDQYNTNPWDALDVPYVWEDNIDFGNFENEGLDFPNSGSFVTKQEKEIHHKDSGTSTPDDNSVSDSSSVGKRPSKPKLTLEEKRKRAAEASKASREKKRKEKESLKRRQFELLNERQENLKTIAQLEYEVQTMRNAGDISLKLENELLRAELLKHRQFVTKLRRVISSSMSESESLKMSNISVNPKESEVLVNQAMSLLASSAVDQNYHDLHFAEGFAEYNDKVAAGILPRAYIQCLPLGSKGDDVKQFVMRNELEGVKVKSDQLPELYKLYWNNKTIEALVERMRQKNVQYDIKSVEIPLQHDKTIHPDNIEFPDGSFNFPEDPTRDATKLFYVRETLNDENHNVSKKSDGVFLSVFTRRQIPLNCLRRNMGDRYDNHAPQQMVDCTMLISSSTRNHPVEESDGVIRAEGSTNFEGHIIYELDGEIHWTSIASAPNATEGAFVYLPPGETSYIDENYCYTEYVSGMIVGMYDAMVQMYAEFDEKWNAKVEL